MAKGKPKKRIEALKAWMLENKIPKIKTNNNNEKFRKQDD
jgi:hypothetical protein